MVNKKDVDEDVAADCDTVLHSHHADDNLNEDVVANDDHN